MLCYPMTNWRDSDCGELLLAARTGHHRLHSSLSGLSMGYKKRGNNHDLCRRDCFVVLVRLFVHGSDTAGMVLSGLCT